MSGLEPSEMTNRTICRWQQFSITTGVRTAMPGRLECYQLPKQTATYFPLHSGRPFVRMQIAAVPVSTDQCTAMPRKLKRRHHVLCILACLQQVTEAGGITKR